MLLRLLEENWPLDIVLFYNTGMEFESIYNLRDQIKPILADKKIQFVELTSDKPFEYWAYDHQIKYKYKEGYHYGYGWCGGGCRWGTALKRDEIQQFKKTLNDEVTDYVGIAADEPQRFEKSKRDDKVLPLVEWGMSEENCLQYCRSRGYDWIEHTSSGEINLYDILKRVSCWCCRNKNYDELRNIYCFLPEYWERLKQMQTRIPEPFKKRENETLRELEVRFNLEKEWITLGNKLNTKAYYAELRKRQEASRSERKSGEIKFS